MSGGNALPGIGVVKLSSGSTGEPRGIAVAEAALIADMKALHRAMRFGPRERFLASIPWSHSYGFSLLTMSALCHEALLVLPEGREPTEFARAGRATVFPSVPPYIHAMARRRDAPRWPASLRRVITAGAPL